MPRQWTFSSLLPFSTGIWSFSLKLVEIRRLPKSMKTRWNLKSSFFPLNWYSWCCPRIQSEYLFHCPWCCSHRRVGGAHLLVPAAAPTPPSFTQEHLQILEEWGYSDIFNASTFNYINQWGNYYNFNAYQLSTTSRSSRMVVKKRGAVTAEVKINMAPEGGWINCTVSKRVPILGTGSL